MIRAGVPGSTAKGADVAVAPGMSQVTAYRPAAVALRAPPSTVTPAESGWVRTGTATSRRTGLSKASQAKHSTTLDSPARITGGSTTVVARSAGPATTSQSAGLASRRPRPSPTHVT